MNYFLVLESCINDTYRDKLIEVIQIYETTQTIEKIMNSRLTGKVFINGNMYKKEPYKIRLNGGQYYVEIITDNGSYKTYDSYFEIIHISEFIRS